mmetsp:Transcript_19400/g.62242  ORF Transcript_19400/g.62242 Transcript_19400/m.62242 type:complete len:254 (+) Transcript_19400:2242-3003(+)
MATSPTPPINPGGRAVLTVASACGKSFGSPAGKKCCLATACHAVRASFSKVMKMSNSNMFSLIIERSHAPRKRTSRSRKMRNASIVVGSPQWLTSGTRSPTTKRRRKSSRASHQWAMAPRRSRRTRRISATLRYVSSNNNGSHATAAMDKAQRAAASISSTVNFTFATATPFASPVAVASDRERSMSPQRKASAAAGNGTRSNATGPMTRSSWRRTNALADRATPRSSSRALKHSRACRYHLSASLTSSFTSV